jgi:glycosyltransferase involved in cell wall biosynthesis
MRILFDGLIFHYQRAGGINRYFAEIMSALPATMEPVVTGVTDFGQNAPVNPRLRHVAPPAIRPYRLQQLLRKRWWQPRLLRSVSLAHPTYYDLTGGLTFSDFRCPVVITVYDMICARFPKQMLDAEHMIRQQRAAVARADHIICISHSAERDLVELMPEALGKTEVIYLASSFDPVASTARVESDLGDAALQLTSFLVVGARGGHKNFLFLLHAFARALSSTPSLRLIVAGAALSSEEQWQMYRLGIAEKVVSVVYPDEHALQQLYRSSAALLYPSFYEGFGIPPLEAMAMGTLAVVSNTSSLPEVVGDAGIMLDPIDADAWTDCMLSIAAGWPEREAMLARGKQRASQFSWKDVADKHIAIYERMGTQPASS